ncbi:MAG: tRNA dihydrouridine synthase DusB [Methanosphaera stadtmanae]|nr:tRNA dihydrouridine synthase DusB [Methanosphaera stadtmanae]
MKWKIGDVTIDNQIVLAPMAGVCDYTFRNIVKSFGCGLIINEMVSDKSIIYGNCRIEELLYMKESERPFCQQIFGAESDTLTQAATYIEENMKPDIIDINMGCPVAKVAIRSSSGSALLKNPENIHKIVEAVTDAVDTPVTVKIRSGWDEDSINAVEVARIIEESGADAITVHPRTRSQQYEGKSDWNIIKSVKDNVDVPVIGNGDIDSCYKAEEMIEHTGCDAVMIGRGVLGNPWLVSECIDYLDNNVKPKPVSLNAKLEMVKKHIQELYDFKKPKIALIRSRMHAAYYVKGLYGSINIKKQIFQSKSKDDLINLLEEYFQSLMEYEQTKE